MIREAIIKLSNKENLSYEEAEQVMNEIMEGQASQVQMAAYLTALSIKGENIDEITASAAGMRAHCIKLLHDMVIASRIAHLSSYSANLLVSHLDTEAIAVEYLERLLKGCIYRSYSPLPVLLLKFLRSGKLISIRFVIWGFYPELEFSCTS